MMINQTEIDLYIADVLKNYGSNSRQFLDEDDKEIQEIIIGYIRKGLLRLNLLSEDDPVWKNDKKTTLYKLGEYLERASVERHDSEICWIAIAMRLYYCSNDFGRHHFEHLIQQDFNHIYVMVCAAQWVYGSSGYDTTGLLRESLEKMRLNIPEFDSKLSLFGNSQNKRFQETAIQIRRVLDGVS
jgi:hypothetical protein